MRPWEAARLRTERAEPGRAGGELGWGSHCLDGSWPPAPSCSCDPGREPAGPAAPARGLLQELPLPHGALGGAERSAVTG